VSQHLLRHRLKSRQASLALDAIAANRGAAICPHCYTLTPLPSGEYPGREPVRPLELSANRLSGEGFIVNRIARGIEARIQVAGPEGPLDEFPDPIGPWNRVNAVRALVVPWVLVAVLLACLLPPSLVILGTAIPLSVAYLFRILVRVRSASGDSASLVD